MPKKKMTKEEYASMRNSEYINKVVELLQAGTNPWRKPWVGIPYQNPLSGAIYSGRNPLYCSTDVLYNGYTSPLFAGAGQAKQLGWIIKKGSKATWIRQPYIVPDKDNPDKTKCVGMNYTPIFNLTVFEPSEDTPTDKAPADIMARFNPEPLQQSQKLAQVEDFISNLSVPITHMGDRACYSPTSDKILMPPFETFQTAEAYAATLLHEEGHSTGHPTRCDRDLSGQFGTPAYAFEELVAELTSIQLCEELSVDTNLANHASYLDHWHEHLACSPELFWEALKLSNAAVNWLKDQQKSAPGLTKPETDSQLVHA